MGSKTHCTAYSSASLKATTSNCSGPTAPRISSAFRMGRNSCVAPSSHSCASPLASAFVLKDPLRMMALAKGLAQLCEEGATQLFRPLRNAELILGAVGPLQFEVVAFRLADEYAVQCVFEPISVHTARWISAGEERKLEEFQLKAHDNLARDHSGALVYLAPSRVNLQLTIERFPGIRFSETREPLADAGA